MRETPSQDPRVLRTHAMLMQALTDLLNEKTFDEIRVKDICERAGVHRSTFYLHFEDKIHLLTFGFQELMDILIFAPSGSAEQFEHAMYRVFKYFKRNQQEYELLLLNPQNTQAKKLLLSEFARSLKRKLRERAPQAPLSDLNDRSLFFTGGLFSILTWWMETGAEADPHQMARRFREMFFPAFTLLPPEDKASPSPETPASAAE